MKRIVLVGLFTLLAIGAEAQSAGRLEHGRTGPGRGAVSGFARSTPGRVHPGHSDVTFGSRSSAIRHGFNRGRVGFRYGFGLGGLSLNDLQWNDFPDYGSPDPVQQSALPPMSFEDPPRPVQSSIQDYGSAMRASIDAPTTGASTAFGIVLKDGTIREAIAVVVNDDLVKYVDADERNREVALGAVDREATRKLNRERKLNLWLP